MRIIIAGGRDFNNLTLFNSVIKDKLKLLKGTHYSIKENIEIISGHASGADTLGEDFANKWGLKLTKFPAEWDNLLVVSCVIKHNKFGQPYNALAGHNRNKEMAKYAKEDNGVLIAFHDGKSTGTKNMINLANEYGLKVFIINY